MAVHLWYLLPPTASISKALAMYESAFQVGQSCMAKRSCLSDAALRLLQAVNCCCGGAEYGIAYGFIISVVTVSDSFTCFSDEFLQQFALIGMFLPPLAWE